MSDKPTTRWTANQRAYLEQISRVGVCARAAADAMAQVCKAANEAELSAWQLCARFTRHKGDTP